MVNALGGGALTVGSSGNGGAVVLNGAGTYTGPTTISSGTLKLGINGAIPSASAVTVNTTGAGGLDLNGHDETLNGLLTLGGATAASQPIVATGAGTLTLGSNVTYLSANNPLGALISGNLSLGSADRTFTIGDSTTALIDTLISAAISGAGGLVKDGAGTMELTGANTYTGPTTITNGILQANDNAGLPGAGSPGGGSNLRLPGGILQSDGSAPVTFSRALGTGPTQVQWSSTNRNGGFAGGGAKLTVNIGGNTPPDTLLWSGANFVSYPNGQLLLSSASATAEVELRNNMNLAGMSASRIIQVGDNANSAGDFATISGVITNGILEKGGAGTLKLTAGNKYAGGTAIGGGGALQAVDGVGLPTASYLQINGGVLESSGAFSRALGGGAGKVFWTSDGGFSAAGGKLTVTLAGTPSPLVWASTANFIGANTLIFGSVTADSEVEFTHDINLNNAGRTVQVTDDLFTNGDFATLSGVISSTTPGLGSLTKTGSGLLRLTGANTYSSNTVISAGVLEAVDGIGLPFASNLQLGGGVLQSTGTLARTLGTSGGSTVQWSSSSGFAAGVSKLTVNLNSGAALTWTMASFVGANALIFGSTRAGTEVEFQNAINLNNAARTIRVNDNPSTTADFATLSGIVSSTTPASGLLTKTGAGILRLTANNTYAGTTTISLGTLLVNGTTAGQDNYSVTATTPATGTAAGATLGGTGVVGLASTKAVTLTGLNANNLAMIAPGDAAALGGIGTLTVQGDVNMGNYSALQIDADPVLGADRLNVNGCLFLDSSGSQVLTSVGTNAALYVAGSLGSAIGTNVIVRYTSSCLGKFDKVYYNGALVPDPENGGIGVYKLVYGALNNDAIRLVLTVTRKGTVYSIR